MKRIELLAPAGSMEALKAAVENGADAVYLGGDLFSARQNADNFQGKELIDAVNYAHRRSVKIFVAVNTLIANQEIQILTNYLYQLANAQVDALIVQDLGIANLIRSSLPQMELHASTQMAVHNSAGVNFLEEMGFTRAVLAREVSLENIQLIKERTSLDLETFVHGALCVAYSGQCLMSSMIGGRSGNRGYCAQPCRMKYSLVDGKGNLIAEPNIEGEHLLSPKDLKMIEHIPDLVAAGIASLKIEGRMKRPEYVATVVNNYRMAIDAYYADPLNFRITENMKKELKQIFNREFTTGYYFGNQGRKLMSYKRPNNRGLLLGRITKTKPGIIQIKLIEPFSVGDGYEVWVTKGGRIAGEVKEIFYQSKKVEKANPGQEIEIKVVGKPRVGDRVFKTHDVELMQKARESFLSPKVNRKIDLKLKVFIEEGERIRIIASDGEEYSVTTTGKFIVEKAQKHLIDYDILWKQFSRLGNTPFELVDLQVEIVGELMVPISELNQLRRQIVDDLLKARQKELEKNIPNKKEYLNAIDDLIHRIPPRKITQSKPLLSVLVGNPSALKEAVNSGADQIYINWEGLKYSKGFTFASLKESINYCHQQDKKVVLRLPRLVSEIKINNIIDLINKVNNLELDGFLVGNLGILQLVKKLGCANIYADYTLNIFNDFNIQKLLDNKIVQATLSPELTLGQVKEFSYLGNLPLEVIVHGNFPLMVSEYCAVGSIIGRRTAQNQCEGACIGKEFGLKDRMNFVFPLVTDENCRMLIYNAKPLNLYKDLKAILASGINVIRIEGRKENAYWVKRVTEAYRQAIDNWVRDGEYYQPNEHIKNLEQLEPGGYTTGHYFRGVL